MTQKGYVHDADGFDRVRRVVHTVERGGIEHPFYQSLPPVGMEVLIGKADSEITAGNSGTVSLWAGTAANSLSDTSQDVTAYARIGTVGSGKWVYLLPTAHGFEVVNAECDS